MAVALAAVDVTDVDLTAAADVEAVAMTVVDVVTASQAQPILAHTILLPDRKQDGIPHEFQLEFHSRITGEWV